MIVISKTETDIMAIEPLTEHYLLDREGTCYGKSYPNNAEIMNKINEIIKVVNNAMRLQAGIQPKND
jgi:uncharacterized membrane protein